MVSSHFETCSLNKIKFTEFHDFSEGIPIHVYTNVHVEVPQAIKTSWHVNYH